MEFDYRLEDYQDQLYYVQSLLGNYGTTIIN